MSAVAAEALKVRTVPGLTAGAIAATLLHPLASLLVATSGGVADAETLTAASGMGVLAGLLVWGAWAAAAVAGEHQHGTIGPSLLAVGGRRRLLGAQAVTLAAIAAAGSLIGALLALGLVRAALPGGVHDAGPVWRILAVPLVAAAVAVGGVAIGALVRSIGSAAAVVLAVLLVPRAAAGLLGPLQPWVVGSSPGTVVARVLGLAGSSADQRFPGGAGGGLVALLAVSVLVVAVAGFVVGRRSSVSA